MSQEQPWVKQLAPTGVLRIALNYGNVVLAQRGDQGEPLGVSADLGRELAKRLGVTPHFIEYEAAAAVANDAQNDRWDIAFMAIDPKRGEHIRFTTPYVLIEGTYMVHDHAAWLAVEELDRQGVRIAVGQGAAYDLFLSRHLEQAALVKYETSAAAIQGFVDDDLDAVAGVRQTLQQYAQAHAGFRVLGGHFTAIHQAMALPKKDHDEAVNYVQNFLEEQKASGFVAAALKKTGQDGATVAP